MFHSNEEDNSEGLLNYVNQLKVLQDKTASRDQFASQRIKLYNLIEQLVQMDQAQQSNRLSSLESNSRDRDAYQPAQRRSSLETLQINQFPNFPTTFPVSLKRLQRAVNYDSDEEMSDMDSDLMDSDEMIQGMGVQEQNERLRQMTLPVFFKNVLQSQISLSDHPPQISEGSSPQRPQNFDSDDPDVSDSNFSQAQVQSESFLMQEDHPNLTGIPRYFDEIIILQFNQARGVLSQLEGLPSSLVQQLPQREIDLEWIKKKGEHENNDFKKCLICLMEYDNGEKVRTLPCLHFFHTECIDFWLQRSKRCPLCKNYCDQFDKY